MTAQPRPSSPPSCAPLATTHNTSAQTSLLQHIVHPLRNRATNTLIPAQKPISPQSAPTPLNPALDAAPPNSGSEVSPLDFFPPLGPPFPSSRPTCYGDALAMSLKRRSPGPLSLFHSHCTSLKGSFRTHLLEIAPADTKLVAPACELFLEPRRHGFDIRHLAKGLLGVVVRRIVMECDDEFRVSGDTRADALCGDLRLSQFWSAHT
jgi:hypothetical protein